MNVRDRIPVTTRKSALIKTAPIAANPVTLVTSGMERSALKKVLSWNLYRIDTCILRSHETPNNSIICFNCEPHHHIPKDLAE